MTIEDLARLIQKEFAAIREEMATKEDIAAIREEMATKQDIVSLRDEILLKIDSSISPLHKSTEELFLWVKDLEARVSALEGRRRKAG